MPRVTRFEISTDDPERAIQFYSRVFGWEIQKWNGPQEYWLVKTGPEDLPGINGGLFRRRGPTSILSVIDVPSIDDFMAKISENGGQVVVPKMAVPSVGYVAYCQDTEGNTFGLREASRPSQ